VALKVRLNLAVDAGYEKVKDLEDEIRMFMKEDFR
jgi:hypothetical protein